MDAWWRARVEEETMGNRSEKGCREEKENKVSDRGETNWLHRQCWLLPRELAWNKGLARRKKTVSHVNVAKSHDRDGSRCKEGSWKYWLERWTSCWAWESQCSRNHGAKGLALPVRLFSWNEHQWAFFWYGQKSNTPALTTPELKVG